MWCGVKFCSYQSFILIGFLWCLRGPCVIRPFNFHLKSKIENRCQFLIFVTFYHKKTKVPNQKFLLFFLLVEYCIFTLILSTIKRKMKVSGNFAFPTMLQSVAWLSFSVFGESLKIENCNQFSSFVFRPKHSKSSTELSKRKGEGSIRTITFAPSALSLWPGPFPCLRGLRRKWEFNCLRCYSRLFGAPSPVLSITASSQTLDVS